MFNTIIDILKKYFRTLLADLQQQTKTPESKEKTLPPPVTILPGEVPEPTPKKTPKKTPTTIGGVAVSLQWYGADKDYADKLTAMEIEHWILRHIEPEYNGHSKDIGLIWKEKRGDSTDKALLAEKMLEYVGIKSQRRHGFANEECHGWLRTKYYDWLRTKEYTLFIQGYDSVELIGGGFW